MSKFFTWLTKGTKILRILTYLYRGLVVATKSLEAAIIALKEVKPDLSEKTVYILSSILEYMKIALEAVEKILVWLGVDTEREAKEAVGEAAEGEDVAERGAKTLDQLTKDLKEELGK